MTDEQKLYGAYYQPDRLRTGGKAIKELHKITSMSRKNIRSWLAKQALWQVHIPPPKEIHRPHYNVTKPNRQHQFDLLYISHDLFKGNMHKYIFTGPLEPKSKLHLCLKKKYIRRVVCSNTPKYFHVIMGQSLKKKKQSCLKNTMLIFEQQQQNTSILIRPLWNPSSKNWQNCYFKIVIQEVQDCEKVSTIWVKNLNEIVNKMNNTKSSMIDMKPKDAIKLDTVPLDKKYAEETVLPEDGLYRYLYQPGEQYGDQKRRTTNFIWSKNTYQLDRSLQEPGNRVLHYLQDGADRAFVREEFMHISEDIQVPLD